MHFGMTGKRMEPKTLDIPTSAQRRLQLILQHCLYVCSLSSDEVALSDTPVSGLKVTLEYFMTTCEGFFSPCGGKKNKTVK